MNRVDQKVKPEQKAAAGYRAKEKDTERSKKGAVKRKRSTGVAIGNQYASMHDIASKISSVPSYQLNDMVIAGASLKWIHDTLKSFDVGLAEVLNTSQASLYRQFKKEDIDIQFKDHLVSLMRIIQKGVYAFEDEEDFKQWLVSKIENLGNRRPVDLLTLETGRREVEQALNRIEYGVYG